MKKIVGILFVLLLACVGVVSANIVLNPSFEFPVNTISWQVYPDGTAGLDWHVERGLGYPTGLAPMLEYQRVFELGLTPDQGNQYAELDSYANVNISQMISTTAGKMYFISFAQACRSDGGAENPSLLGVYWGDTYLGSTSCTQTMTWVTHSYSPTAASTGQIKLMFVDEGPSNMRGVLLDDVVVEEHQAGYFIVQKTHDPTPVNPGDIFTYTITVTNPTVYNFWDPYVFDLLPDEVEFVSCSGCDEQGANAPHIDWEGIAQGQISPGATFTRTITVRLKQDTAGKTFCNNVVVGGGDGEMGGPDSGSTEAIDCITIPEEPIPAPEFPSALLPTTMIIGFLGAVLLIRRTREH